MKRVVNTPVTLLSLVLITHSRSYTMFANLAPHDYALIFVTVVVFIVAPLLIGAAIAYGQGEDE